MRINLILSFTLFLTVFQAQTLKITPVKYQVNALYDRTNGAKYSCDKDGRFQDELVFYTIKQKDTVILFKSAVYNSCLKGLSEWFNADGQLIRQTQNYEGGCTVQASSHQFAMTGKLKMNLSSLIEKSSFWDKYPPHSLQREEFYTDGLLSKRIYYYKNGKPFKVVQYALKNNYKTYYYSNEYDKYEEYGTYIQYNENGTIAMQGEKRGYKNIGTWNFYSEAGILESEKKYFNPDSIFITNFYPSGAKKSQETQLYEHKIGEAITFYETGEIASKTVFSKSGQQQGPSYKYFPSGKLMEEIPCCGYFKNGTFTKWYENGKIEEKYDFTEGITQGKYNAWHLNGQLKTKGQYDEYGSSTGKWYTYNEKGKLISVRDFDQETMEVPMAVTSEINTFEDNYPVQSIDLYEFSHRLADSYVFRETTYIPGKLRFLKKQSQIEINVALSEKGIATFEILTSLSPKQKEKLQAFLIEKVTFDGAFKIGNSNVPCEVSLLIQVSK